MKYAIILPDGAADEPLAQLSNRTPLQAARIPHMDWVASHGRMGRSVTVPSGFVAGTDVATLSLLGYDPHVYYSGRAPLEARAKGLKTTADQLIFRSNFVTIADGRMKDFTAGHISQPDAEELIAALNKDLAAEGYVFHAGVSYRNLMVASHAEDIVLTCAPPHDIPDQPVADHMPRGKGAERVMKVMDRASAMLARHPVNARRIREGRSPATHIWLWGQGRPVHMETFQQRFGLSGAAITGVDILRGISLGAGMELIAVPGATGYLDTDYEAKGRAGVRALEQHDLVLVHVEAPDEAGHQGDAGEKVKALERVDEAVVGPMLQALRGYPEWRVLIAPDHPTPVGTKAHSATPPPFCYAGTGVEPGSGKAFTEADAIATGLMVEPSWKLINAFLGRDG